MAPKRKDTGDTIDKRDTRRPQIVLRTLPPIVFTSSKNTLAFQLTMSVPHVQRSQPAVLPDYEDFGGHIVEQFGDPAFVKKQLDRVDQSVGQVTKDLAEAKAALGKKIDAQKTYMDERFAKVDGHIAEVKNDIVAMKDDIVVMKDDIVVMKDDIVAMKDDIAGIKNNMEEIRQMLQLLVPQGGVPPTPLASSSPQAHILPNLPQVVVDRPPSASSSRRDTESLGSVGSQRELEFRKPSLSGSDDALVADLLHATLREVTSIDQKASSLEQQASSHDREASSLRGTASSLRGSASVLREKGSKMFKLLSKSKERLDQ